MSDRLTTLLLGEASDREQRLRLRRLFMAAGSYAMWFGLALAGSLVGLVDVPASEFDLVLLGLLLTNLALYAAIRSGFSRRFADPSLTSAQIMMAMGWILLLMAVSPDVRGLMMLVYLVTMLFGIFHFDRREFGYLSAVSFLLFVLLVVVEHNWFPGRRTLAEQVLSVVVLGGLLAWVTLFGGYVSDLRHRLVERNEELRAAVKHIQELAIRDELTGIFNRRYIVQAVEQEKSRADRFEQPFSVILLDLDRFKQVNDRYGHVVGDAVLKRFAEMSRETLRGMDVIGISSEESTVGRFGGEEFIVILPDTRMEGAMRCAERLRTEVNNFEIPDLDQPVKVTFSAGVAEYRREESIESLLSRADQALYEAKRQGRDRVCEAES